MSAAGLANVLAGRRKLSMEMAVQIADRLGYSREATRRLCRMVQAELTPGARDALDED